MCCYKWLIILSPRVPPTGVGSTLGASCGKVLCSILQSDDLQESFVVLLNPLMASMH